MTLPLGRGVPGEPGSEQTVGYGPVRQRPERRYEVIGELSVLAAKVKLQPLA